MAIVFKHRGDLKKTKAFLREMKKEPYLTPLDIYGRRGVDALRAATPKDTGKTAESWEYRIERTRNGASVIWTNTNRNDGVCIALILQYGHGTRNGGYVQGLDYINPAMRGVFEELADAAWQEVTKR